MMMEFKTGDLVYALDDMMDVGAGIVTEQLDHDIVNVYWFGDGIIMASPFDSIEKLEAHNNEV
jgi:hypothetical protein